MKFRMNILLSVVLHMTIIALAFAVNFGEIVCHVPEGHMVVSLFREVTDFTTTFSQNTTTYKKNFTSISKSSFQDEIPKDRFYKDEAILVLPHNNNASFNELTTSRVNAPYEKNAITIGFTQQGSRFSDLTKKSFSGEPIQGGNTGDNSLSLEIIRTAIEKAKSYPLLARKKRIEGTVLVRFIINKNGLPQGIQIIRSSGSHILDEEVSKIIKRAAPFPEVNHEIVAPITFKLTEPHVNR